MPKGNKTEQDKKILQGIKNKREREKSYIQKTFDLGKNQEEFELGALRSRAKGQKCTNEQNINSVAALQQKIEI